MLKPKLYVRLASAEFAGCRIERLFVKARLRQAIRFSDWRNGRFKKHAMDIPEAELVVLLGDAIAAGVFSRDFLCELQNVLAAQDVLPKDGPNLAMLPCEGADVRIRAKPIPMVAAEN